MQYPHILSRNALTLYVGGVARTLHSDDQRWERALDLLRADDGDALVTLLEPAKAVREAIDAGLGAAAGVELRDGRIWFNGQVIDDAHDYAAAQILSFHAQGLPFGPLVAFYNRLQANPSFRVRRDLLKFLEVGQLPITEDGCFMAYKRVTSQFKDVHSGRVDYTPGTVASMPREAVDDDPNHTCSAGLHVCSYEYLAHFSGDKVISVKVDPADVVSIPTDYNNTKMRVCRLTSVEEIPEPDRQNVWDSPVVGWNSVDTSVDFEEQEGEEDDEEFEPKFECGTEVMLKDGAGRAIIIDVDSYDRYHPYQIMVVGQHEPVWVPEDALDTLPVPQPEQPEPQFYVGDQVWVDNRLWVDRRRGEVRTVIQHDGTASTYSVYLHDFGLHHHAVRSELTPRFS